LEKSRFFSRRSGAQPLQNLSGGESLTRCDKSWSTWD